VCVGGLDLGLFLSPAGRRRDNAGDGHRSDHVHQHQRRDHRHRLFRFLGTLRENGTPSRRSADCHTVNPRQRAISTLFPLKADGAVRGSPFSEPL
jgi:hypothetical protein